MLSALRHSRGYGKFRRNRWAMVAFWIIAAYALLAGWVWAMEGVQWLGKATGAFSLSQRPVLGLLLPERTTERVGPRWLPAAGFGQSTDRRLDQADFLFKEADGVITKALSARQKEAGSERVHLAEAGFAERRLADVPLDELARRRDAARAAFAELDRAKAQRSGSRKVAVAIEKSRALIAGAGAAPSATQRDDLAFSIEEVMFALEDYQKKAVSDDPLRVFKLADLQAAADAMREPKEVIAAPAVFDAMHAAAAPEAEGADRAAASQAATIAALGTIEPAVEALFPKPSGFDGMLYRFRTLLGTDAQGRSILIRALYSAKVAIQVGVVVAVISVLLGAVLGSAAAYFGGWADHAVTWLYSTLSSLPQLVLLAVLAFMFLGSQWERTLVPVYAALCLTFWIGPCRVIRGEVLKIKELEYAQAATVIGFSRPYILVRHIVPNTLHLMFINFSLLFIGAVKTEVILTFLGLGIKEGASWGLMISQAAPEVVNGIFWQISAATMFMLVLVLAFNVVSDALQDAFDPRHVG